MNELRPSAKISGTILFTQGPGVALLALSGLADFDSFQFDCDSEQFLAFPAVTVWEDTVFAGTYSGFVGPHRVKSTATVWAPRGNRNWHVWSPSACKCALPSIKWLCTIDYNSNALHRKMY